MISRSTFLIVAFLLAVIGAPPAPSHRPPRTSPPGSVLEETARRHVEILEKLAGNVEEPQREELRRLRDEAAQARESAARALNSRSRNEWQAARSAVQGAFEESRAALGRLAASRGRQAEAAREALTRINKLQERARRAFESLPGAV
ncbi:MAG: hypothetical protein ACREAA_06790 [Candidatus Polarisedimenticolia bacterium]